jgi:hypothetical protein
MIKADKKTGLIFFPAYDWEITPTHPERKERLLYTQDQVLEEGILDIEGIHEFKAGLADEHDISRRISVFLMWDHVSRNRTTYLPAVASRLPGVFWKAWWIPPLRW